MRSQCHKASRMGHSWRAGFTGMALATVALAGCGGHDGPVGSIPTQPNPWTLACAAPDILFSPRDLRPDTFSIGSIHSIAADAEVLFFATYDEVYRVPAAGGEPERVIANANGFSQEKIWQVGGRFLLSRLYAGSKLSVVELPRTGTNVTTLIDSIPYLPGEYKYGSRKIFWIDEAYVYWQATRPFTQDGKEYSAYPLHRMPLQGDGPVENLVELTARLSGAWKQGESFWILDYPNSNDSLEVPRLLSLPASGGIAEIKTTFARGEWLVSGDETSLYFDLTFRNGAYHPGAGRFVTHPTPRMEYLFSGNVWGIWPESDRAVVMDFDYVTSNPAPTRQDLGQRLWTVPLTGGAATPIGCLNTDSVYVETRVKVGQHVFLSMYWLDSKLSGIAKLTLP